MSVLLAVLFATATADAAPLSLAEAARSLRDDREAFARADANGDGRIDDRELEAVRLGLARQAATNVKTERPTTTRRSSLLGRAKLDANADGALTPNELYFEAR